MQENIQTDLIELEEIVNKIFEIKIKSRKRSRVIVDARMVYSKILRERGHTVTAIGKFLGKDHTTIVHYGIMVDDMLAQLPYYHNQYVKCYTEFMKDKEPTVFSITEKELQMSNISLKSQLERLILENTTMQIQVDKYKRLEKILEYVENRTPIGKESFVLRKINLMFNGLSDYGQELKW
jgi:hypothetical protein